jgi:hypothetical protein
MRLLEKDIQKAFIDEMEYRGAVVIKINNVGIMKANGSYIPPRQKGISDTIICYKGRFIAVEFKLGNNKPTIYQQAFIESVIKAKGLAFFSNNAGEAVKKILEAIK